MLEAATAYLATRLATVTAVDVVYNRPTDFGSESSTIKATRGSTPFEATNEDGSVMRWETRDYLTEVAEFPYGEPIDGDTIVDDGRVYQVQSLPGQQPFRYADPGRSILRIHTKMMSVEDA